MAIVAEVTPLLDISSLGLPRERLHSESSLPA
jgi:hypothetical protein